jgi:hypothetical protein
VSVYLGIPPTRYTYGRVQCDAYHGGLEPPPATIDLGRRWDIFGKSYPVRFLCDDHARGRIPPRIRERSRLAGAPEPTA